MFKSNKYGFKYEAINYDFGGDRYLKTGEILPDSGLQELRTASEFLSVL